MVILLQMIGRYSADQVYDLVLPVKHIQLVEQHQVKIAVSLSIFRAKMACRLVQMDIFIGKISRKPAEEWGQPRKFRRRVLRNDIAQESGRSIGFKRKRCLCSCDGYFPFNAGNRKSRGKAKV